jgi:hypothetical protein
MQFAHWLMVAGAALVVLGFIGFVVRKNDAEPAGNNLEPATQSRAEGEEEMSDEKRSTDPGLSAAERKKLRGREAKEAIADHEEAQRALHGNLDRLRAERLAREATAADALSCSRASGRYADRSPPTFNADQERAQCRGTEDGRRDTPDVSR